MLPHEGIDQLVGDHRHQLGHAGADHRADARRGVEVGREPLAQAARHLHLRRIHVRDGEGAELAVRIEQLHGAPVGELRDGGLGDAADRLLDVERAAQELAGLGEEPRARRSQLLGIVRTGPRERLADLPSDREQERLAAGLLDGIDLEDEDDGADRRGRADDGERPHLRGCAGREEVSRGAGRGSLGLAQRQPNDAPLVDGARGRQRGGLDRQVATLRGMQLVGQRRARADPAHRSPRPSGTSWRRGRRWPRSSCWMPTSPTSLTVRASDEGGRDLLEPREPLLVDRPLQLELDTLRHVHRDADQPDGVAVLVLHDAAPALDPPHGAVRRGSSGAGSWCMPPPSSERSMRRTSASRSSGCRRSM